MRRDLCLLLLLACFSVNLPCSFQLGALAKERIVKAIVEAPVPQNRRSKSRSRKMGKVTYEVRSLTICHAAGIRNPDSYALSLELKVHNGSERTMEISSGSFLLLSKNGRKVPPTPWEKVSLRSGQSATYPFTFDVTEQQRASSFFLVSSTNAFPPIKLPISQSDFPN